MEADRNMLDELHEAHRTDNWAFARHLCEQFLAKHPDNGPVLITYAGCLTTFALYDEAKLALDRAEAVIPDDKRQLLNAQRGHLLVEMGDFDGAEAQYMAAHDLDPIDASYLVYAGSAAFRRGDIQRAEQYARAASECVEGCIDEAYFNLGGYLLAQERHEEARTCYLKALEIDPGHESARERLEDLELLLKHRSERNP